MSNLFDRWKPMLAGKLTRDPVFPAMISPKIDGIRATVFNGAVWSRKKLLIPSLEVQLLFGTRELEGFDGELVSGPPTASNVFNRSQSACMSTYHADSNNITFHIFDRVSPELRFHERVPTICNLPRVKVVPHQWVRSLEEIEALEAEYLSEGYEGAMLRDPHGPYKFGRSTDREGYLLKIKRFEDSEARVLSWRPQMQNNNVATVGELGQTKRTSHKANKLAKECVGSLEVQDLKTGVVFNLGTGLTDHERFALYAHGDALVGRVVCYRFLAVGVKDKPRHPSFKGFRDERDMS